MSWRVPYYQYDDDALTVYANAGLLRRARKDAENGAVTLTDDAAGVFTCDGQQVTLSADGIQHARCDCPAPGGCKHILAAVLWLQSAAPAAGTGNDSAAEPPAPLLPELLTLDPALLQKQAGKPGCRLAATVCQQWENQILTVSDSGSQLSVTLPDAGEPVIYLRDGGFSGMMSGLPAAQKKGVHLAVIVKLIMQQGGSWSWPDDAAPVTPSAALSEDEKALIAAVGHTLDDCLQQGLSHISKSAAQRLHFLNMSARAEGLPRLAAYLRSLSGRVTRLAERHFTMDEAQVLRYMAMLSAYLFRLSRASGDSLAALRGRLRREYTEQDAVLSLLPVSADWWEADSGASGATFTFWDSDNQQLLQSTQARAAKHDQQFSRNNVWTTLAFWKQTAGDLMRRPFRLHKPKLTDDGKLSPGSDTYAETGTALSEDIFSRLKTQFGTADWATLPDWFAVQDGDMLPPYLLYPESYHSLTWYETEQCAVWEITDSAENAAYLRLYWGEAERHSLEELRFITEKRMIIRAVTVQPVRRGQRIDLIPAALWLEEKGEIRLFYPDFDFYPRPKKKSAFISHIQEYMAKKKQRSAILTATDPTLAEQVTRPVLSVLEALVCTGRTDLSAHQRDALTDAQQAADILGLSLLSAQLADFAARPVCTPDAVLRLVWLCDRMQLLRASLPLRLN